MPAELELWSPLPRQEVHCENRVIASRRQRFAASFFLPKLQVPTASPTSYPQVSVESAILDCFGKMFWIDVVFAGKIRDGARDLENAIVTSSREPKFCDGVLHNFFALRREDA